MTAPPPTITTAAATRPIWHTALPLVAWWVGLPLWWALGIQRAAAIIVAVPLGLWLLNRWRRIEMPAPFVVFAAFLGWVLLSALAVTTVRYGAAYGMRLAMYTASLIIGLYVWNALRRGLSPRVLIWPIVVMWAAAILLSFPGILHAGLSFTSPVEWLMQRANIHNPFLYDSAHPQFSEWDQVYGTARPSALFSYTNEWGAAIGLTTPVTVYAMVTAADRRVRLLLAALLALAVVPILISLNRGCWISLGVALGYVVLRRAFAGDLKPLGAVVALGALGASIVAVSPLSRLLEERFDYGNTSTRATLYETSLTFAQRSPLIGYGAPQSSVGVADSNDVAIGTHGQLWTVLVSQGFVGAALFVCALATYLWFTRPTRGLSPEVWLHAVGLVLIVQIAFYEVVPDGLAVASVALCVCATVAGRHRPQPPPPPDQVHRDHLPAAAAARP